MKLLVVSDLHLEHGMSYTVPQDVDFDVAVLAGDVHSPGNRAVHWAQRESTFGGKPVVLVAGNHEFYGCEMATELREMKKAAEGSNVHVMDRDAVTIGGVRFLGCTLWTDFQLPRHNGQGELDADIAGALASANLQLNDFQLIQVEAPASRMNRPRQFRRLLQAEDTMAQHWVDRDWLRKRLAEPHDGTTVVVTHHAPSVGSVAARYHGDPLAPAFVSDLPDALFEAPSIWIHGHTHTSADYEREGCRVVSNPRGYKQKDGTIENKHFVPNLVIQV